MLEIIKMGDQLELVPTSSFPSYAKFSFEKLNCVQSRVFDIYNKDCNIVISANTSAGKTVCGEMVAAYEIREKGGKVAYLAPLKALAQEKVQDWTDPSHHFSDLKVAIITGDYKLTSDRKKELENANVIIFSTEMMNSRCRNFKSENNEFLKDISCVITDECFPYKTRVLVDYNVDLPIGDIVKNDKITHVLSYDEVSGKIIPKKIIRRLIRKYNPLVSVHHKYGKFTCTKEHKIWTTNGYKKAGDLTAGDVLKWIPLSNDLKCSICGKKFDKRRYLISHYLYSHLSPGGNAHHILDKKECSKCGKSFSVYGYPSHFKGCGKPKRAYIPKTNECKICGKKFVNATKRARHESHHSRNSQSYYAAVETRNNNPNYWSSMKKMGRSRMGKSNPIFRNPVSILKLKAWGAKRWKNLSEDEKLSQINRFINAPLNKTHGTKLELRVEEAASWLAMRRTSGGKFWLTFTNGKKKNPDFKVNGQRKVVEVGDIEYWHTLEEIEETKKRYKEIGYDCLYLTNEDVEKGQDYLKSVLETFVNNHDSEVTSIRSWGTAGIDELYDLEVEDCHNYFAEGVLVSNCHLLTVPGRGDHLEVGLMKFTQIAPNARHVFLSATMPNVAEIAEWMQKITNKQTCLIQSTYRPCPLGIHFEQYIPAGFYEDTEKEKVQAALQIVIENNEDKFLIFAHTKRTGEMMKQALIASGYNAEFHSADLSREKRVQLENKFRNGDLQCIVATSTLSWGVNLPARRVVILGVHRGMSEVETYDLWQCAGRAGRPKYDPRGDVYILVPNDDANYFIEKINQQQPITSRLLDHVGEDDYSTGRKAHYKTLAFHLVSEIHHGNIKTKEETRKWYERSLAHFQAQDLEDSIIDNTIELLTKCGALKEEDGQYKATVLGMISSMFYYSPFDVADLKRNFKELFSSGEKDNDLLLTLCLGNIDTQRMGIVSKAERADMKKYRDTVFELFGEKTYTEAAIKAGFAYYTLINGENAGSVSTMARTLQWDYPRMSQVLQVIDGMSGKWGETNYFKEIEMRVAYGVPTRLVGLCHIPEIGKVRAEKLYSAGIRTISDVATNLPVVTRVLNLNIDKCKKICEDAKLMELTN